MKKLKSNLLTIAVLVIALSSTIAISNANTDQNAANVGTPFLSGKAPADIENIIAQMSFAPGRALAEKHGIAEIRGKKLALDGASKDAKSPRVLADRPVGADPVKYENEPSIAAKPNSASIVVAASHSQPDLQCRAYTSTDSGETWSSVLLPLWHSPGAPLHT